MNDSMTTLLHIFTSSVELRLPRALTRYIATEDADSSPQVLGIE